MKMSVNNPFLLAWLKRRNKHVQKCQRLGTGVWSCGHIEQYKGCTCHVCAAYAAWWREYTNKMKEAYNQWQQSQSDWKEAK